VKDSGTGHKKLLVARSDEGDEKICGGMRFVPTKQELNSSTGRETNAKQSP